MNNQEYEQKRVECWEECAAQVAVETTNLLCKAIAYSIFDRAYSLGKEKETITQEEIENEAVDYAFGENKKRPDARPDTAPEYMCEDLIDAFKAGANFALGKQEKDAEGEDDEMLYVSRKQAQELYSKFDHAFDNAVSDNLMGHCRAKMGLLKTLFGSKCLPDEVVVAKSTTTTKPAEPKFKVGDKVRFKYCCTPYSIDGSKLLDGAILYQVGEVWAAASHLEHYTEPKKDVDLDKLDSKLNETLEKETKESPNDWIDKEFAGLIRVGDKVKINLPCHEYHGKVGVITHLDRINAGSVGVTFDDIGLLYVLIGNLERVEPSQPTTDCHQFSRLDQRLHVACMAMQGILANPYWMQKKQAFAFGNAVNDDMEAAQILTKEIAEDAVEFANALIVEVEKGGKK